MDSFFKFKWIGKSEKVSFGHYFHRISLFSNLFVVVVYRIKSLNKAREGYGFENKIK